MHLLAFDLLPGKKIMNEFSLSHLNRHAGELTDKAMMSPILLRKHGRPHLVMMSFDHYQTLIEASSASDEISVTADDENPKGSGLASLSAANWLNSEVPEEF